MPLKKAFVQQLKKSYPGLNNDTLDSIISENLISPFKIELPTTVRTQAQKIVKACWELRENKNYQNQHLTFLNQQGLGDPGNKSILMSYDFHLNNENQLKLIEINTNAAFMLMSLEMHEMQNLPLPIADFNKQKISEMILNELKLQNKNVQKPSIAIIDDKPEEQRLFIEFLAYNELFKQFGWTSKILDYTQVTAEQNLDFIYNRYTDFMLSEPTSATLKKLFAEKAVCLSPNPYDYHLLADKQRMIEWTQPEYLEQINLSSESISDIRNMLPAAFDVTPENKEELWSQRKKLFFKPKRAYGSKQSYKGSSISRKHFDDFCGHEMIAQEFVAAPEKSFDTPTGIQNFKFDLRCYAYQDQLQMIVARIYQGQVTNLRTPLGGFGCVVFT